MSGENDQNNDAPTGDNDILGMSDEEVMKMNSPPAVEEEAGEATDTDENLDSEDQDLGDPEDTDDNQDSEDDNDDSDDEDSDEDSNADGDDDSEENADDEDESTDDEDEDPEAGTDTGSDEATSAELDAKAKAYDAIFAPFNANGIEVQAQSPEDVIRMMQMGANYHKKMAGIKPLMKIGKMLENNGLLDEAKINFLIDLDKKKPEAIKKLVGDSDIDPLDIDGEKQEDYTPETYNVSDAEVELEAVLVDIRGSKGYPTTVEILNNKWDDVSRKVLLSNPDSIRIINAQVESGVYAQVMDIVAKERAMGKLQNVPDIDAYKQVGAELMNKATQSTADTGNSDAAKQAATDKQTKEQKRAKKRKAAASPTKTPTSKSKLPEDFNPLNVPDEEFEKMEKAGMFK